MVLFDEDDEKGRESVFFAVLFSLLRFDKAVVVVVVVVVVVEDDDDVVLRG